MENYLFFLELFVENVSFSSNLPEYPRLSDVVILGEMGKFLTLDVSVIQSTNGEQHKDIILNCGKTVMFASTPDDLFNKINENPFVINLLVKQKQVASADVGWTRDFYTLVKTSNDSLGIGGPVTMHDQFLLKEKGTEKIMGDIKASVKLSSFGVNMKTSFQVLTGPPEKTLVKGARCETIFECQKLGLRHSSDVYPLTTILPSKDRHSELMVDDDAHSFMAIFKSTLDPKFSILPEEFNVAITRANAEPKVSDMTFDIISLCERPEENKYIDLRIKGGSRGFIFEFDGPHKKSDQGVQSSSSQADAIREAEQLTVNQINERLCKNKDCPAAKKFKELGIGPLANTKGLGGLYGEPPLPVTYGMSQTYGVFDEYGPYGLFSRPKRPSDPFVPKQDNDWTASCWKPNRKKYEKKSQERCGCQKCAYNICHCQPESSPLRLSGGGLLGKLAPNGNRCEITNSSVGLLKCPGVHFTDSSHPLRLTGGGVLDYGDVKSPFYECKEIMDQYDEVLRKYKKALGPCGKTTCPFAPNVTKETCKKMCKHGPDSYSIDEPEERQGSHIETAVTPRIPKPACGSPKCAYAKYKTGLIDEDAEMELQFLPSPTSGKCGHPKCPSPIQPDLPPIHWDCPDPLPKGRCKNPDCPYLPKEIKCLNAVLAKGPCGNFNCPFSPPPPCSSPNCPFASKECPYKQQTDSDSICQNQECPFKPKTKKDICDNPTCPFAPKICQRPSPCYVPPGGDSTCPYIVNPCLQNTFPCPLMVTDETLRLCFARPDCPYTPNVSQNVCSSPTCPFQKTKSTKTECTKPPPQKKTSPCYIPGDRPCGNPNCPHLKKLPTATCEVEGGEEGNVEYRVDTRESIDNAPCSRGSCKSTGGDLQCEECGTKEKTSAECPFSPKPCYMKPPPCYEVPSEDDVCSNPECPFIRPPCTIAPPCMTVPPCYNPLQALLSYCLPLSICPDGICPYPGRDNFQICFGGIPCPTQPAPCLFEEKSTKDDETCENEECPYASIVKDGTDLPEGIEYHSETRIEVDNAPCSKTTCKRKGGELVCEACSRGREDLPDGIDYTSDTRISVDMAPCTKKICKSKGEALVCDYCMKGTSIQKLTGKLVDKKGKKRKRRSKFVYSLGDRYPGVQIGHKECVMPAFNVPPNMGWLWNISPQFAGLKPRRGWRPGAIAKTIAERIRKHREAQGFQMLELKDLRKGRQGYGEYKSDTSVNVQPKPTLHIKKHDGCYWITMNPLKDPHTLVENESPYMDCTPLQFKIVKNKDKQKAEDPNEYQSCFCGDETAQSSSSDSELEIEFTPPAGIIHPERFKRKKNVVHCDTQYMTEDFEVKVTKSATKAEKKKKKDKKGKKGKKGGKKDKKGGKKDKKKKK